MRVALSNGIRFEVFKRDLFTCQYCGEKAPEVVLNVDHIDPVSNGGTNDLLNLITSCATCNSGKSDKLLSDDTAVAKSRRQAELMEERKQQVEMMADWAIALGRMEPEMVAINRILTSNGLQLSEGGSKAARQWVRKFGLMEVLEVIALAYDKYSTEDAWGKIGPILNNRQSERADPNLAVAGQRLSRMVMRMGSWDWKATESKRLFSRLLKMGWDAAELEHLLMSNCRTWYQAKCMLEGMERDKG